MFLKKVLDLNLRYLEKVRELLVEFVPTTEVWVFGSRINGNSHPGSDLDLLLRNTDNPEIPNPAASRLGEAFRNSEIPILVDLQDWATIPDSFRREILGGPHEVLQAGS